MFVFHRKEQDDIIPGGVSNPLLVIGWKVPGHYHRLLCLWARGLAVSLPNNRQKVWTW